MKNMLNIKQHFGWDFGASRADVGGHVGAMLANKSIFFKQKCGNIVRSVYYFFGRKKCDFADFEVFRPLRY